MTHLVEFVMESGGVESRHANQRGQDAAADLRGWASKVISENYTMGTLMASGSGRRCTKDPTRLGGESYATAVPKPDISARPTLLHRLHRKHGFADLFGYWKPESERRHG